MKKKVFKFLQHNNKNANSILTAFCLLCLLSCNIALAGGEPKIFSGTEKLLEDVCSWLLALIPIAGGCALTYQGLQKALTDDQAVVNEKNRNMKNILISTAIAVSASGLIKIFLSYYK